jgi:molybdopterin molybdotransferase
LAERVRSPIDLPPFDNSSMDGYAVRASEVLLASAQSPVRLRLAGRVAAGETLQSEMQPGSCVRLFTGSPMPRSADAVVMQEDTRVLPESPNEILILSPVERGENIRLAGEDVRHGAILIEPGEPLSVGRVGLLAAVGRQQALANRVPTVGLLATGSELREPGQPLEPGQIYESNRVALAALIRRAGGMPSPFPLVPDTLDSTIARLREAFTQCDAVISSGGVSVGEMDFIKPAFAAIGGELDYWKVAIRPGRPFVFGRWQNKPFFGLPGNPISALVTFLILVRPALLRWQGAVDLSLPTQQGVLAEPLSNPGERRHFMRVKIDGQHRVFSAGLQASHALSSAAAANGLVDVAPRSVLGVGTAVEVMRWE